MDNRCGDGGDEKKDRSREYKEGTDMVEKTRFCHVDGSLDFGICEVVVCCWL